MSVATLAAAPAMGAAQRWRSTPAAVPATLLGLGLYLTWFGVHYWHTDVVWPSDPIKAILTGKPIPAAVRASDAAAIGSIVNVGAVTTIPGAGPAGATGAAGAAGASGLVAIATKYVGTGYQWGGRADRPGNWDCSSFVSYCLHEAGLPLPGGRWGDPGYPPNSHGPTTGTYLLYGTPVNRTQIQPGDLVVWPTHMGIVAGPDRIVAARGSSEGTGYSGLDATSASLHEVPQYRRPPGTATVPPGPSTNRNRPV